MAEINMNELIDAIKKQTLLVFEPQNAVKFWKENLSKGYLDTHDIFSVSETAKLEHQVTFVCTFTFFFVIFINVYAVMRFVVAPKFFLELERKKQYETVILIIANVHHLISTIFNVITILFQCNYPFAMFYFDQQCLRNYKPIYSHMVVFSFSYLTFDLFMQVFFYQDFSPLGQQNLVHHFVSFVCYACSLAGGMHMPMVTHMAMICEFSQIFLNIRNSIGKQATGALPLINNLCFFLTYTLLRVVLFPWLIMMHFKVTNHYDLWNKGMFEDDEDDPRSEYEPTTRMHQGCWVLIVTFFFLVLLLNLFWYSLILKGLLKLFTSGDTSGGGSTDEIGDGRQSTAGSEAAAKTAGRSPEKGAATKQKREKIE